jgi:hypothetical protein
VVVGAAPGGRYRGLPGVRRVIAEELGLDDPEPVVLTFEISGETESRHAAELLAERSSGPEGLASGLYRRIEEIVRAG